VNVWHCMLANSVKPLKNVNSRLVPDCGVSDVTQPTAPLIRATPGTSCEQAVAHRESRTAGNQTRTEILDAFQQSTMYKLPVDEFEYFEASDTKKRYHFKKFKFMADNARFVSLRGYFDSEIVGDNTLNPGQREFIKLAQILKSRLITEIELKQRIVERALIEERVGDYKKQLKMAFQREQVAQTELENARKNLQNQVTAMVQLVIKIDAAPESQKEAIAKQLNDAIAALLPKFDLQILLRERGKYESLGSISEISDATQSSLKSLNATNDRILRMMVLDGNYEALTSTLLSARQDAIRVLLGERQIFVYRRKPGASALRLIESAATR